MTTWFTADQHYGHGNIIRYCARPFRDVQHMHAELIARHNARVLPNDLVYNVGDFSLDATWVTRILPQLHGQHILVAGNHDRCHPMHRAYSDRLHDEPPYNRFLTIAERGMVGEFVVAHLPYLNSDPSDDSRRVRLHQWRPIDDGERWLLHGHVHQQWRALPAKRMLNVGVDVWDFAPVSLDEVRALVLAEGRHG